MADINGALHSLQTMQQNAQAALPVIPNNGNPGGAYNMARVPAQGVPVSNNLAPPPTLPPQISDRYPWLRPSPSMDNVRKMLQRYHQPQAQQMPQQVMQVMPEQQAPVLPMYGMQLR